MSFTTLLLLIIIGLLAGFFSGMFGIGGGVVMVPLMVFLLSYTQYQAQGTSLAVLAVPVTLLAAYTYHKIGEDPLNWKYALIIAITFIVGGFLGTKVALNINESFLKKIFSVLLVLVAVKMFFSK
ncbi:sulfite exporter TauE/SafE family protein [Olleya sp. YS]|uniref:sulfite exporter TauE/SafE family protein n=1 Tax=Olleya sp. YS TaxID=3028318 RepID=UPI00243450A2|nr:sulfite exporter TauE/SafE family protein [Olleya sp. YS]WGD34959.1 sulfite exporter TauE/SafE family protein [Olleya sp. YS]